MQKVLSNMKQLIVFLSLLCSLLLVHCFDHSFPLSDTLKPSLTKKFKVLVEDHELYDFHAEVYWVNSGVKKQICGGSIIHRRIILTASQCISTDPNVTMGVLTFSMRYGDLIPVVDSVEIEADHVSLLVVDEMDGVKIAQLPPFPGYMDIKGYEAMLKNNKLFYFGRVHNMQGRQTSYFASIPLYLMSNEECLKAVEFINTKYKVPGRDVFYNFYFHFCARGRPTRREIRPSEDEEIEEEEEDEDFTGKWDGLATKFDAGSGVVAFVGPNKDPLILGVVAPFLQPTIAEHPLLEPFMPVFGFRLLDWVRFIDAQIKDTIKWRNVIESDTRKKSLKERASGALRGARNKVTSGLKSKYDKLINKENYSEEEKARIRKGEDAPFVEDDTFDEEEI